MSRRANIFVNYRREDSAGHAGRLFDRLSQRFPERVFMDVDTIQPGIDFVESIEQAVGCCEVLIVMIGREWLHLEDAAGKRRLDNPNDFVRLEIAAALDRNIRIIPVLVEGTAMPRPDDLPPDLARLTRRNAIELSDVRWTFDVDRLILTIEAVLQEKAPSALMPVVTLSQSQPAPARSRRKARARAWMFLNAVVLLSLAGWIGWRFERQPAPQPSTFLVEVPVTTLKPARPAVSEQRPKPSRTAAKPTQKPTIPKRAANVLKTAGQGITSLLRKGTERLRSRRSGSEEKRESPLQR
jgi:hypothetical protein